MCVMYTYDLYEGKLLPAIVRLAISKVFILSDTPVHIDLFCISLWFQNISVMIYYGLNRCRIIALLFRVQELIVQRKV